MAGTSRKVLIVWLFMLQLMLSLICLQAAPTPAFVTGIVYGVGGKPAPGAVIGPSLRVIGAQLQLSPEATTDAQGRFKIERERWMTSLIAYSQDRTQATSVKLGKSNEVVIRLQKAARLKLSLDFDGKPYPGGTVMLWRNEETVAQFINSSSYSVPLPPGTYGFSFFDFLDEVPTRPPILLAPGETVDLGVLKVQKNALGRMIGNQPPEIAVSEARGVPASMQLKDFKGRWVLLEFWGYW